MKMKLAHLALALFAAGGMAGSALAQSTCTGTGAYRTCTDLRNGNSYQVNRIGNTTNLNGYNANTGSSWNATTTRIGNSSFTNGTSSDGQAWNATTNRVGNSTFTNGTDSRGRSFNSTTTKIGDSTFINSTDSRGNTTTKVCNAYGCY